VASLVASGTLSILLGILTFMNYPEASLFTLGLFLAIELFSSGVSLIALSLDRRRQADA
jgi:membrane protein HdeD